VVFVNVQDVKTDELVRFDKMMMLCAINIEDPNDFAPFATSIWIETLKELDLRGSLQLTNGSFDDPFNALIQRNY
jgi:hypothetical protein